MQQAGAGQQRAQADEAQGAILQTRSAQHRFAEARRREKGQQAFDDHHQGQRAQEIVAHDGTAYLPLLKVRKNSPSGSSTITSLPPPKESR